MSAYLESADHLAAITRGIVKYVLSSDELRRAIPLAPALAAGMSPEEALFNALLDENLKSVGYRYPDATRISDWCDAGEAEYTWDVIPETPVTPGDLDAVCRSYEYQSCEHPEWDASFPRSMVAALRTALAPLVVAEKAEAAARRAAELKKLYDRGTASPVESAKLLKKALSAAFPFVKFSVTLSRGTAYGYCSVRWTDGPTAAMVDKIAAPFEGTRFDGMTDCEEHTPSILPNDPAGRLTGLRAVTTSRDMSSGFRTRCAEKVAREIGLDHVPDEKESNGFYVKDRAEWFSTLIWREAARRAVLAAV